MSDPAIREVRRALIRLRRALAKSNLELGSVSGSLRHAEGADFPTADFEEAVASLHAVERFVDHQMARLEEKILHAGGLEPGRVRRHGTP